MGLEIHVACEHPRCDESAKVPGTEENFDVSSTVSRLQEGRWHFFIDTGWINGPEGWTLGADDQILCPKHRVAEASP